MYQDADIEEAAYYYTTFSYVGSFFCPGHLPNGAQMRSPIWYAMRGGLQAFLLDYLRLRNDQVTWGRARLAWDPPRPRRFLFCIRPRDPPRQRVERDWEDDDYE